MSTHAAVGLTLSTGRGFDAKPPGGPQELRPWRTGRPRLGAVERRAFGSHDGQFDFEYCGMRYSDVHRVRGDGAMGSPHALGH